MEAVFHAFVGPQNLTNAGFYPGQLGVLAASSVVRTGAQLIESASGNAIILVDGNF